MTAPTIPGLEDAIERVYLTKPANFQAPDVALEDAIGMWWYDVQREVFDRWACEEDKCPGRPAWDITLSEQGQAALDAARAEALALVRQRMTEFAERFQSEHPEAQLREVEPSE